MDEKKEVEMAPDELKLLIEENQFLKYWLLSLNGFKMTDEEHEGKYEELWNNIALAPKLEASEKVLPEEFDFYFKLFDTGIQNFGIKCFEAMANTDPVLLGTGINALVQYVYNASNKIAELEKKNKGE